MERTCVGCRTVTDRVQLVRLVAQGDPPELIVDIAERLPHRGAWVHPSCWVQALKRRAFIRALRVQSLDVTTHTLEVMDKLCANWEEDAKRARHMALRDHESGLEADGHPMSTQR
ncbi:MAG: YlxR family protein [Actinomycetaceae bacterium]|nr:YlxR family protein [Actinomycetaceae bacterium]